MGAIVADKITQKRMLALRVASVGRKLSFAAGVATLLWCVNAQAQPTSSGGASDFRLIRYGFTVGAGPAFVWTSKAPGTVREHNRVLFSAGAALFPAYWFSSDEGAKECALLGLSKPMDWGCVFHWFGLFLGATGNLHLTYDAALTAGARPNDSCTGTPDGKATVCSGFVWLTGVSFSPSALFHMQAGFAHVRAPNGSSEVPYLGFSADFDIVPALQ